MERRMLLTKKPARLRINLLTTLELHFQGLGGSPNEILKPIWRSSLNILLTKT
jgi:hypothetical protein